MKPIFIILYAVFITLLLTTVLPRLGELGPRAKHLLRLALLAGVVALVVVVAMMLSR